MTILETTLSVKHYSAVKGIFGKPCANKDAKFIFTLDIENSVNFLRDIVSVANKQGKYHEGTHKICGFGRDAFCHCCTTSPSMLG
jgi:hypothetical protein